jgi:hypothetical protein
VGDKVYVPLFHDCRGFLVDLSEIYTAVFAPFVFTQKICARGLEIERIK